MYCSRQGIELLEGFLDSIFLFVSSERGLGQIPLCCPLPTSLLIFFLYLLCHLKNPSGTQEDLKSLKKPSLSFLSLRVHSFEMVRIRMSDLRSLRSWHIKWPDESFPRVDFVSQFLWCAVMWAPCDQSFLLSSWVGRRKGGSAFITSNLWQWFCYT